MVGPVMRTVLRQVASSAVEGAAFELHAFSGQEHSWRAAQEHARTRTPSSADGGLSSISTPAMPVLESVPDEEQREEVSSNNWPSPAGFVSPFSNLEMDAQDSITMMAVDEADDDFFDLNDGFALPPPLILMPESSPVADEELALEAKEMEPMSLEVPAESEKILGHEKASNEFGFEAEVVSLVLCQADSGQLLKDRPSLVAALEHCSAVNSRREQLRRRGAVRVGRRRVACRARTTSHSVQIITATARRCQPWAGAR
mmetsp:Transcript_9392/g.16651  ORF Transcript_9392/g.16651 Transcript_9392/m.16651 type:complete len:258 (-) Transcript_9392:108-881(-)